MGKNCIPGRLQELNYYGVLLAGKVLLGYVVLWRFIAFYQFGGFAFIRKFRFTTVMMGDNRRRGLFVVALTDFG